VKRIVREILWKSVDRGVSKLKHTPNTGCGGLTVRLLLRGRKRDNGSRRLWTKGNWRELRAIGNWQWLWTEGDGRSTREEGELPDIPSERDV
jgi:hypothetical protein